MYTTVHSGPLLRCQPKESAYFVWNSLGDPVLCSHSTEGDLRVHMGTGEKTHHPRPAWPAAVSSCIYHKEPSLSVH